MILTTIVITKNPILSLDRGRFVGLYMFDFYIEPLAYGTYQQSSLTAAQG